jgi:diacylglycerol O-acyltransferase / wax synthase
MDRLNPQDASFLHIEQRVNHMHIGGVGFFEGPPPAFDDIVDMVESKLHYVPRYRQVVLPAPLDIARPVWSDDEHFNIRYHIRHTALPAPGGREELENLMGRIMSQQLDRSKPLWEMWVVEGLEDNQWALISKIHHCMVDGVAGTELVAAIMDLSPDAPRTAPVPWTPAPSPGPLRLLANSARERLSHPREQIRSARALFRGRHRFSMGMSELVAGLSSFGSVRSVPAETSLNGPIGPHRRWSSASASLADVKAIRKLKGGTVNDVVLAAITSGFRALLISRGEPVGRVVRTLVPVSVRAEDEKGTYNNRVSMMLAELPVGIEDPAERLAAITQQLDGLKERKQAVAAETLISLTGYTPPMLLSAASRLAIRFEQSSVQTVTTNVPGPQIPLYVAGRRMLASSPYVPLAGTVRIGIAIFSYCGQLSFGVTADYETVTDIDVLCRGIEDGIKELLD